MFERGHIHYFNINPDSKFVWPTSGPPGSWRPQVGPTLAPRIWLLGNPLSRLKQETPRIITASIWFSHTPWWFKDLKMLYLRSTVYPDSKVDGASMGPTWGRQDPSGPHVGHMNLPIWVYLCFITRYHLIYLLYQISINVIKISMLLITGNNCVLMLLCLDWLEHLKHTACINAIYHTFLFFFRHILWNLLRMSCFSMEMLDFYDWQSSS